MKKNKAIILALFCCLLWGFVYPILQLLYAQLNLVGDSAKITLAGTRFFSAGIIVMLYYILSKKRFPKITSVNELGRLSVLGLFQTTLLYAFLFIGASNSTGIQSAVLAQIEIFFVVVFAHFLLKNENMTSKKFLALALGLIGMVVININSIGTAEVFWSFTFKGEGFLIISGAFGALGFIIAKVVGKNLDPVFMNGWQLIIGGGLLLLTGRITYGQFIVFPNMYSVFLMILLILISAIAFTVWYYALQFVNASEMAIYKFTIPIIGSVASAIVVPGEILSFFSLLGLALVSGGIYLSNKH